MIAVETDYTRMDLCRYIMTRTLNIRNTLHDNVVEIEANLLQTRFDQRCPVVTQAFRAGAVLCFLPSFNHKIRARREEEFCIHLSFLSIIHIGIR